MNEKELLLLKRKQLQLLEKRKEMEEILPHLYVPMYQWQRTFFESKNRANLLTASNQSGKSSILMRRAIANCTDPKRWEILWPGSRPNQFWYFYPDSGTVEREVETKWVKEWLPRGPMEKDQQYGWKLSKKYGIYNSLSFNCGPTIYFQMYNKAVSNLQAATIHEIFADEELPMHFYDELMFRLTTTEGIFSTGFTPTLNQLFWREAMNTDKNLPHALKLCVSMYDCLKYEDGSPSRIMTLDKIKLAESRCSSETEKQRRVFGKFVTEEGRSYFAFDYDKHVVPPKKITGWQIIASVDYGSGEESGIKKTKKNHPAAILFLAVRDDYKKGAVFKCWRGDSQKTTAGDIYNRYADMVKDMAITTEVYDASSADFGTIATRNGRGFVPANKARDAGEDLVNTLFKHGMLEIFDDDSENMKLASELMSMMLSNQRGDHKKEDDLADALRYAVMAVPWDLTAIINKEEDDTPKITRPLSDKELLEIQIEERRGNGRRYKEESSDWAEMENDFAYWNSEYEGF